MIRFRTEDRTSSVPIPAISISGGLADRLLVGAETDLQKLQKELDITYLYVSHDLSVVEHMSHRIAVMYLGKMVEVAPTEEFFDNSQHPYSQALFSAIPIPNPEIKLEKIILLGDVPSAINPPSGCRFHPRCRHVIDICNKVEPKTIEINSGHLVACHLFD